MSDPAWVTGRTILDGSNSIVYIRAAGATGTPGTANELGWATGISFGNEAEVTEKGPHINRAQKAKTIASYSANAEITVDVASGADTVRNLFFTAIANRTRLQVTYRVGGASGEQHVFDQCVVGFSGETSPADGTTYTFTLDADVYTHTPAT
jgi:hypothetical protein